MSLCEDANAVVIVVELMFNVERGFHISVRHLDYAFKFRPAPGIIPHALLVDVRARFAHIHCLQSDIIPAQTNLHPSLFLRVVYLTPVERDLIVDLQIQRRIHDIQYSH